MDALVIREILIHRFIVNCKSKSARGLDTGGSSAGKPLFLSPFPQFYYTITLLFQKIPAGGGEKSRSI